MKAQSCKEIILPKLIYKLNKIPIQKKKKKEEVKGYQRLKNIERQCKTH